MEMLSEDDQLSILAKGEDCRALQACPTAKMLNYPDMRSPRV
jgi:hypothetical protein